jgi:hypothetical protein
MALVTPAQVLTIVALALPHGGDPSEFHSKVAGWTLEARKELFTGRQVCRLHRGMVEYQRRTLVFHLPQTADTSDAAYRIDDGAPYWVRFDQAALARRGFRLHDDDLQNPSGGIVRITLDRVGDARSVIIEPKPFGFWRRFTVQGIREALTAALAKCSEDAFERSTDR